MSKELIAFKKHFERNCSIKVIDTIEESRYPHWKRLCFQSLNCTQMVMLAEYIFDTFSNPGDFSHDMPKVHSYADMLCLTVDVADINKKILNL